MASASPNVTVGNLGQRGLGGDGHAISTETPLKTEATQGRWSRTKSARGGREPFLPIPGLPPGWCGRLGPGSFGLT